MTVRTKDELLALFPDNTARAIHPQGIRDLVDSVAVPGPTFKYWCLVSGANQIPGILDGYSNMVPMTELHAAPGGAVGVVDMSLKSGAGHLIDVFSDPGGWLQTDEWIDDSQYYFFDNGPGATDLYPPNTTLLLGPGRYTAALVVGWAGQPALTSGGISAYIDFAEGPISAEEGMGLGMYDLAQALQTTATTIISNVGFYLQPLELQQQRHVQVDCYGYNLSAATKVTSMKVVIMQHE